MDCCVRDVEVLVNNANGDAVRAEDSSETLSGKPGGGAMGIETEATSALPR